jgi:hypothetical protein
MDKRILWAVYGLLALTLAVMAHMFRYEPLSIAGHGDGTLEVWDRWRHRICIVAMGYRKVGCTVEELQETVSEQTSTGKESTKQPHSLSEQIQTLRAAGFSEKEIEEWIQSKKDSGTKPLRQPRRVQ